MRTLFLVSALFCYSLAAKCADQNNAPVNLRELAKSAGLAKQLHSYSAGNIKLDHFKFWLDQLQNDSLLERGEGGLASVRVRDVAIICLEAMAGMEFLPAGGGNRHEVAGIVSHKLGDDVFRYSVTKYETREISSIRFAIQCWLNGYLKGQSGAKQRAK